MSNSYMEQFKQFLTDRLEAMLSNPQVPWVKATVDPILNGYNKPYKGLNLLVLTHFCRIHNIPERIFSTFLQRKHSGKPVWKDEKGCLVTGKNGKVYAVFPSTHVNENKKEQQLIVKEQAKEFNVKLVAWSDGQKKYPFNEKGICSALYDNVMNRMPIQNSQYRLVAELVSAAVAAFAGISKTLELQNIQYRSEMLSIIKNDKIKMDFFKKTVLNEMNEMHTIINDVKLDPEKYKKDIELSLNRLMENQNAPKKIKLENLLTPRIRI